MRFIIHYAQGHIMLLYIPPPNNSSIERRCRLNSIVCELALKLLNKHVQGAMADLCG